MPNVSKVSAERFRDEFVASCSRLRNSFTKDRWDELWRRWKGLMLARPEESSRLPRETSASVLADVAANLGLCYPSENGNREPMTLDAVFSAPSEKKDRFPIRVAIEHEDDWTGFESEIRKLLSVRCPLKVGITYTGDSPKGQEYRDEVAGWIREDFDEIKDTVKEYADTEYLFLIGAESNNQEISSWYSLSFRASEGPGNEGFSPVTPVREHEKGAA